MSNINYFMVQRNSILQLGCVHRGPILAVYRQIECRRLREAVVVSVQESGTDDVGRDGRKGCRYDVTVFLCSVGEEAECVHFFESLSRRNLLVEASFGEVDVGGPRHCAGVADEIRLLAAAIDIQSAFEAEICKSY